MQEKIVKYILTEMSDSLDSKQQVRLQEVLLTAFEQVVMMPTESEERQREQTNSELLKAFISAKKIEGCSEKTLC
ncbi:MAG: integrase, partial [Prevotella salivae]|nr:integrase [Segatella salivae]